MNDYYISTDIGLLNVKKICALLQDCFWSKNIPIKYVERFIQFSLCFGIYQKRNNQLIGFGRVISDYTTYAYICDVVVEPSHRNRGLGKALIKEIMSHPTLQGLKTWSLKTTEEAKNIYVKHGFEVVKNPENTLEIDNLEIYSKK